MAFPSIATTNQNNTSATTNHVVNLPASIAAGDLLLIFGHVGLAPTYPAGWTEISSVVVGSRTFSIAYRIADGSEGASVTVTTASNAACRWITERITSWHGTTPPEVGTAATGTSTTPDPPAVTPSWGSADNLFIASSAKAGGVGPTGFPTNYGTSQLDQFDSNADIAVAARQLTASTDNPGTFTYAASSAWGAQTVVIRPASDITFGWYNQVNAPPKSRVVINNAVARPPTIPPVAVFGWFEPYAKLPPAAKVPAGSIVMDPQAVAAAPALNLGWFEPYAKRPPAKKPAFGSTSSIFKFTPATPATAQPGAILLCGL